MSAKSGKVVEENVPEEQIEENSAGLHSKRGHRISRSVEIKIFLLQVPIDKKYK